MKQSVSVLCLVKDISSHPVTETCLRASTDRFTFSKYITKLSYLIILRYFSITIEQTNKGRNPRVEGRDLKEGLKEEGTVCISHRRLYFRQTATLPIHTSSHTSTSRASFKAHIHTDLTESRVKEQNAAHTSSINPLTILTEAALEEYTSFLRGVCGKEQKVEGLLHHYLPIRKMSLIFYTFTSNHQIVYIIKDKQRVCKH